MVLRRKKLRAQRRHTVFELDPTSSKASRGTTSTQPLHLVSSVSAGAGGPSERPSMTSFRPSVISFRPSTADTTDMINMKPLAHAASPPRNSFPIPHLHSPPHHQFHHPHHHRDDSHPHHYREHLPSPLVLSESLSETTPTAVSSSYQAQPQQPHPPQTGSSGTSTPSTSSVSPPHASSVFRRQRNQKPSLDPIETSSVVSSTASLVALSAVSSRERDSPMSAAPRPRMIARVMTTPSISAALAGSSKDRGHSRTSTQPHTNESPPSKNDSSPKQNGHNGSPIKEGDDHPSPPIQPWLSRPRSTTSIRPPSIASTIRPPSVSSVASSSAPRAIEEGEWDYAPESPLFFVCPEEEARREKGAALAAAAGFGEVDGPGKG